MRTYRIQESVDKYPLIELIEEETDSKVVLCPELGGMAIGLRANGRELFYLDRDTFLHPEKSLRGGNPVLFPICGRLAGGSYEWNGVDYRMNNHGFARGLPWEAAGRDTDGHASVTLRLESCEETLSEYPFRFELRFTYVLKDARLRILQEYRNLSEEEMPIYAGFHPYFAVDAKNIAFDTDGTRMLDFLTGEQRPFTGSLDFTAPVDAALLDARNGEISFRAAGNRRIRLTYGPEFKYVVLWSIPEKPFVCVEPWMGLPDGLNAKTGLTRIKPGQTLHAEVAIESEAVRE